MLYKVLITTSGIGSRLGDLTDFTNKALVRIGDKPALSHILESYPTETQFVVTLGHYGGYVREFIEIAHPTMDIEFVEVDRYEGPGTSLGYSILQAQDSLQCPFIFNACDTLFKDNKPLLDQALTTPHNFCIGDRKDDTSQYSTLLVEKEKVVAIKEKGEINYDFAYVGICGIKDYKLFWDKLSKIYHENPNNSSLFEGSVINQMLTTTEFHFKEIGDWLDMGNVGELERTRQYFKTTAEVLEKKEESIYFYDDYVIKFFSNQKINKNRVARARELEGLVPPILAAGNNFYKYRKIEGDLFANSVTLNKFKNFLEWAAANLWSPRECENFPDLCHSFYIDKTLSRISKYLEKNSDSPSSINQEDVPPIEDLINQIDTEWLCDGIPVQFHGDFILDNILETDEGFCLLDWRQDFAGHLTIGDIYYDLAKLNHNLTVNHELVNKRAFNSSSDNCYILCNSKLVDCKEILKNFIVENGYDYKKVQALTAVIWINMAPLHEYPFDKFLFNFGKLNLKRALDGKN